MKGLKVSGDRGETRIVIHLGTRTTQVVARRADGTSTTVDFDGCPQLPSGVYVAPDATLLTGAAARAKAVERPDRFVAYPRQTLADGYVQVDGQQIPTVDLLEAVLHQVAQRLATMAETTAVTMTVPAGWGPHQRTVLRQAATRAGLPQPHLVDTPVAVMTHLESSGTLIPIGNDVLVCDFGDAAMEATLLRHQPDGFEVLAAISAENAGGLAIDTAVSDYLTSMAVAAGAPSHPASTPQPDGQLTALEQVRAARGGLTHTPALTVPTASGLPVILDQSTLARLTQPALASAVEVTRQALAAVDLKVEQLHGVYCAGAAETLTLAVPALRAGLGVEVVVVPEPDTAVLHGAAHTHGQDAQPPPGDIGSGKAGWWHVAGMLAPAIASPALAFHAMATAQPVQVAGRYSPNLFVIANWGQWALAALFAVQAAVAVGLILAVELGRRPSAEGDQAPSSPDLGHRLARYLPGAAAIGASLPLLYSIIAAAWYGVSIGPFLRWAIFGALPIAAAVTLIGLLSTRSPQPQQMIAGWLSRLRWSAISVLAATLGMLMVQVGLTNTDPAIGGLRTALNYVGAALLGVATALALPLRRSHQILAIVPAATVTAAVATVQATGALGGIYVVTATVWWLLAAARLARTTLVRTPSHTR